jgi:hypothetical protein
MLEKLVSIARVGHLLSWLFSHPAARGFVNITSITAQALSQYKIQARQRQATNVSSGTDAGGKDRATFSAEALSLANQSGAPPAISDAQATKISDGIRRKDPETFKRIDSNHDDKLSASEISKTLQSAEKRVAATKNSSQYDDVMVKVGERLQKKDPELFAALDSDKSGKLGTEELTAGSDKVQAYFAEKRKAKPVDDTTSG